MRLLHAGHGDGGGRAARRATREPTEREVREGLEGNLCRCTGYHNIVRAVLRASGQDPDAAEEAAPDLVAPGFSTGSGA